MLIQILKRRKLKQQLCGCFFPYLGNAGNVVRRISHKGFQIDKLPWSNLIPFLYILCIIILNLCFAALRLRDPDLNVIRFNLQKIPVSGNKTDLHSVLFCTLCQSSQNIVRLIASFFHQADPHGA